MKIFLVEAAGDVTGRSGYGKAILDNHHTLTLISFADNHFRNRNLIIPADDDPVWQHQYDAQTKTIATPSKRNRLAGNKAKSQRTGLSADPGNFRKVLE